MSRFIEILNSKKRKISIESIGLMSSEMIVRLEAETGTIEMRFPYFINKAAPASDVRSLKDYEVNFIAELCEGGEYVLR